jgi:hypothetical protein
VDDFDADAYAIENEAAFAREQRRSLQTARCEDGLCGGCPACLEAQGVSDG